MPALVSSPSGSAKGLIAPQILPNHRPFATVARGLDLPDMLCREPLGLPALRAGEGNRSQVPSRYRNAETVPAGVCHVNK